MKQVSFYLFAFLPTFICAQNWKLESETSYYKAYSSISQTENLKSYKVEAIFDLPKEVIIARLNNIEEFPNWMPNILKTKILKQEVNNGLVYFMEIEMPWPLTNRYSFFKSTVNKNQNYYQVVTQNITDGFTPKNELIKLAYFKETIEFFDLPNNQCKVIVNGKINPGGSIPAWVMNMYVTDGPVKTIEALKLLEN